MIREAASTGPQVPADQKLPCVLNPDEGRLHWMARCARALMMTGGISGFLSGSLGVGGGLVIVPALARTPNLSQQSVVGTSLGGIALVSAGSVTVATASGLMSLMSLMAAGVMGVRTVSVA